MAVPLYMDHNVPRAITVGLRLRHVDVVTAYDDGASLLEDAELLDRAAELGRVLFTRDDDLLAEAAQRQRQGRAFGGVIFAHQLKVSIGRCVDDLETIAKAASAADLADQTVFLPL